MKIETFFERWRNQPLKKGAVLKLRSLLNPLTLQLSRFGSHDPKDTLIVAGTPRSGTTWVAEIICTIPRSALVFEPLKIDVVPQAQLAGFDWMTHVEPGEDWAAGSQFLERVLRGQILNGWTTRHIPMSHSPLVGQWVVKFVRANMMLRWMTELPFVRMPLMVIRHPCATVASMLAMKWSPRERVPHLPKFLAKYPQFVEVFEQAKQPEEAAAISWCVQNYHPLVSDGPRPFILLSYERLVRDGERELRRVFDCWNLELSNDGIQRLVRLSATVKKSSALPVGSDRLSKWKADLTKDQAYRVLSIVRKFGLDFYGYDAEPDYDRLNSLSPVQIT